MFQAGASTWNGATASWVLAGYLGVSLILNTFYLLKADNMPDKADFTLHRDVDKLTAFALALAFVNQISKIHGGLHISSCDDIVLCETSDIGTVSR
jgi:hypothetical protein